MLTEYFQTMFVIKKYVIMEVDEREENGGLMDQMEK